MNFGSIIRRSFQLAWNYKTLWIFGLFAGWGGGYFNINWPADSIDLGGFEHQFEGLERWNWEPDPDIIVPALGALLLAMFILGVIWLIIHCISVPTIIDAVNKIERGGIYQMGTSFSAGIDFFWRFLGLFLLGFLAWAMTAIVLIILIITIVGIIIAVPLFIFALYFWFTIFELAARVIVVRNCTIGDGLSEAYQLLKKRFGDTLVMALIIIGLSIAFGIGMWIVWAMIGIPVGGIVWAMTDSAVAGLILGILIGLPISIICGGYFGTFFTSLYTIFYFELVEPTPIPATVNNIPPPSGIPGSEGPTPSPPDPMPPPSDPTPPPPSPTTPPDPPASPPPTQSGPDRRDTDPPPGGPSIG